jgi:hypothetical protein
VCSACQEPGPTCVSGLEWSAHGASMTANSILGRWGCIGTLQSLVGSLYPHRCVALKLSPRNAVACESTRVTEQLLSVALLVQAS